MPHKQSIAHNFSKASQSYDKYADIQHTCGTELSQLIPQDSCPGTILELGCGTGNLTLSLATKYPTAQIVALDFSAEMIAVARNKETNSNNITWLHESLENFLELSEQKFDLIITNATLQWLANMADTFKGINKALSTQGIFLATIFGPQSLKELDSALQACGQQQNKVAAKKFMNKTELEKLTKQYFSTGNCQQTIYHKTYQSLHHLLRQIKRTGTNGQHQQPITFSKQLMKDIDQWFKINKKDLTVSYEVLFIHGQKKQS